MINNNISNNKFNDNRNYNDNSNNNAGNNKNNTNNTNGNNWNNGKEVVDKIPIQINSGSTPLSMISNPQVITDHQW